MRKKRKHVLLWVLGILILLVVIFWQNIMKIFAPVSSVANIVKLATGSGTVNYGQLAGNAVDSGAALYNALFGSTNPAPVSVSTPAVMVGDNGQPLTGDNLYNFS